MRLYRLLLDPLAESGGGGVAPAAPVETPDIEPVNGGPERGDMTLVETPAATQGQATPVPSQQRAVATDPNIAAGQAQPQAPAAAWRGILDVGRERGFQFDPTVTNDQQALDYLLRQAGQVRQQDAYAQLGQQLAPHTAKIQQYLRQQGQPAQPATPTRQPWEAPEFDKRWGSLVDQDPTTGLYTSKQGVPHEIAQKVNAYVEWKDKYDANPAAVLNQMVEAKATEIAQRIYQQQSGVQQREASINQIVQENHSWLYQRGPDGNVVTDYQGRPMPTPHGAAYIQQLQVVRNMGVTDPRQQNQLAIQLVRGQLAEAAANAQHAPGGAQIPPTHLQAQPNVNPLQALSGQQRAATPGATDPSTAGMSLREIMMAEMRREGVTDADIYASGER